MIQPNELLKVGNWVNGTSTQGYTQPVKVTLELLPIILSGTAIITYSGIPITKELLVEKCGAKDMAGDYQNIDIKDDFWINFRDGKLTLSSMTWIGRTVYHHYPLPHIKYLHQLQTLVLSLCGEELKINMH